MKTKFRSVSAVFAVLLISNISVALAQNYNALPWKEVTAYNSYLMRIMHQQYLDRRSDLDRAVLDKSALFEYMNKVKAGYLEILGDFPEKEDLKSKVVSSYEVEGVKIENIVFQSTPGRYVTCNLYMPKGVGPFPVSLELCGHGLNGKGAFSYSAFQMAYNGIAVLVVDPIGQGERIQLIDNDGKTKTRGVTTEHTLLNAGCNLVGSSLAAFELWDNHRAIDYLETRKDINKERIAVYGSSGGGTQAAYLIAYDNRIKASAICSYFSQRERLFELPGPSDGCQHIPYEGSKKIEIADFVIMMAPKPVLILSGKYDFVDLWGAEQGFKEIKKVYKALNSESNAEMFVVETGHGLGKEKLSKMISWFKANLANDMSELKTGSFTPSANNRNLITVKGQVNLDFNDAIDIPKANAMLSDRYKQSRLVFMKSDDKTITSKINDLLGIDLNAEGVVSQNTGIIEGGRDCVYQKYQILRKGEMPVPVIAVMPNKINSKMPVVVLLNESGKEDFVKLYENTSPYVGDGIIVVAADLRGFGETKDLSANNDPKYWNREYRYAMTSMHIGRPLIGQRVTDLISVLDFISITDKLKGKPVKIIANGLYGPVAVHAAYLDKRVNSVEISRSVKTFTDYISSPMQHDMYSNVIYGVLKWYDLGDLIKKSKKEIIYKD